jgi:hypothetical protein
MSILSSMYGNLPGFGSVSETYERAIAWGPYPRYFTPAYIGSTAADPTNSPTWELRVGLVMGKQTATGTWVNYSPTANDGSQVAAGVLVQGLRMQDVFPPGINTPKFYAIMVSGGVQAANLIGLDNQARAQMAPHFIFDDNLPGNSDYEWLAFATKTASYSLLPTDNFTIFDNTGAAGAVTFTLPAIANGYKFGFKVVADSNLLVTSNEGGNVIGFNNAAASTVSFQTGGARIGGGFILFSNSAGTKWHVQQISAGANTVTTA